MKVTLQYWVNRYFQLNSTVVEVKRVIASIFYNCREPDWQADRSHRGLGHQGEGGVDRD